MADISKVNIALDKKLFDLQIERFHTLNLSSSSWLLCGASGSGKSVTGMSLLHEIVTNVSNARLWICDGKNDDYKFLSELESNMHNADNVRYFGYLDMSIGLDKFYDEVFTKRLTGECESRTFELIILEEWSSVLAMLNADKETVKIAKKMLSQAFSITSQGRAYNVHALFILQKPQMDFLSGFRENLTSILALGRLSPEVAKMCSFNEFKHFNNEESKRAIGYFLNDKNKLHQVRIPHFSPEDFARFKQSIIEGTSR